VSDDEDNIVTLGPRPPKAVKPGERPPWKNIADVLRDALADVESGRVPARSIYIGMRVEEEIEMGGKKFKKVTYPHWVMGFQELELLGWLTHEQAWWNSAMMGGQP